jgi:hypothetical protein
VHWCYQLLSNPCAVPALAHQSPKLKRFSAPRPGTKRKRDPVVATRHRNVAVARPKPMHGALGSHRRSRRALQCCAARPTLPRTRGEATWTQGSPVEAPAGGERSGKAARGSVRPTNVSSMRVDAPSVPNRGAHLRRHRKGRGVQFRGRTGPQSGARARKHVAEGGPKAESALPIDARFGTTKAR